MLDFFKAKKLICVDLLLILNYYSEIPAKNFVFLLKKDQYRFILLNRYREKKIIQFIATWLKYQNCSAGQSWPIFYISCKSNNINRYWSFFIKITKFLAGISKGKLRKSNKSTQIIFFALKKSSIQSNSTPIIDDFISW